MRLYVVLMTVCCLLLLPLSGVAGSAVHDHQMPPVSDEVHCDSHAQVAAETSHDCCEDMSNCPSQCALDCGHCLTSGQGSSAAVHAMVAAVPLHTNHHWLAYPSALSHIGPQPTPPPNIS